MVDFQELSDKASAIISNPRIITYGLIGTTTLLIGAFLFFGDDVKEVTTEAVSEVKSEMPAIASTIAAAPVLNVFDKDNEYNKESEEYKPSEEFNDNQQTGGKNRKKKSRQKKCNNKRTRKSKHKHL